MLAAIALLAIAVGAGASGALNMWYDADIDSRMRRTRMRPIPAGRLNRADALAFGIVLGAFSVGILGLAANWLAAGAARLHDLLLCRRSTPMWLKRATAQNIVIGGAAGALPPVIGWAAMTGQVSLEPLIYFLIIFMWTPPHFWALALFTRDDYARVGIPMMPNVAGDEFDPPADPCLRSAPGADRDASRAARLRRPGVWRSPPSCLEPSSSAARSLLWRRRDADGNRAAKSLFGYSIVYLFGLFGVRLVEAASAGWIGG